jgi:glycosyltransferase involved in cell wall biosynthesis
MIVGSGELLEELKSFVYKEKISDYVIFTGSKNNTEEYYSAADCFVLSSSLEGFGIVLVEAMSVGLPTITTEASGACKEILQNNDFIDFIVAVKNSEALSLKMKYMFEHQEQILKIGIENKEKSKRFDINIISDQWVKIYTT